MSSSVPVPRADAEAWQKHSLAFACYGASIGVFTNAPAVRERLPAYLPPGWEPIAIEEARFVYALAQDDDGTYSLFMGGERLADHLTAGTALERLASALHVSVSLGASDVIFVHAGVVGWQDRAIVLPGRTHSGKTTLVKALVEAGALYYSDEFAVFDAEGRVLPYARPLAVRDATGRVTRCPVETLGGTAGTVPLPVGLVAALRYKPKRPALQACTPSQGVVHLLNNTVRAREASEHALMLFSRAMQQAHAIEGKRGEAEATARLLLDQLDLIPYASAA